MKREGGLILSKGTMMMKWDMAFWYVHGGRFLFC